MTPGNSVTVIDTLNNAVVATLSVGSIPNGVGVDPTVHRAYVANFNSNNVTVIDTVNDIVLTTIAVGINPVGIGVDP